jgi:hypothetical protein
MRSFMVRLGALAALVFSLLSFPAFAASLAFDPIAAFSFAALLSSVGAYAVPILMSIATSHEVWASLALIATFLIARSSTARMSKIRSAVVWAFNIVEDLKAQGLLPPSADKAEVALKQLDTMLTTQGVTLSDAEKELAKSIWSAMHGADTKAAEHASQILIAMPHPDPISPAPAAPPSPPLTTTKTPEPTMGSVLSEIGKAAAAAILLFAIGVSGCAYFSKTTLHDLELNCGEPALAAAAAILLPDVLEAAKGNSPNWKADWAKIEARGEDAALCAAAIGVKDFDPSGATARSASDAGTSSSADGGPVPEVALSPAHPGTFAHIRATPQTANLQIAENLRAYLATHNKRPIVPRG